MPATTGQPRAPRCRRCRLRHDPSLRCWRNIAPRIVAAVLAEYGDTCHLCGRPGADTADHLVPRAHWGTDSLDNLAPAHQHPCNQKRGTLPLEQWFELYPITPPTYTPSRDW